MITLCETHPILVIYSYFHANIDSILNANIEFYQNVAYTFPSLYHTNIAHLHTKPFVVLYPPTLNLKPIKKPPRLIVGSKS